MNRLRDIAGRIKTSLMDDSSRVKLQFICVYYILMAVSVFMTIVNIITAKYLLMSSTLIFALLCGINVLLATRWERGLHWSSALFSVEVLLLLTFFIISGTPEGFSAIWACMLPASGLLLFGRKRGSILCAAMFIIIFVLLQTPLNSILQYDYTASFSLRFPMLYAAFFAVSFLLETVRAVTHAELKKTQEQYEYLYSHDALTGARNRYGFNERMDELLLSHGAVALMLLDIDHFKRVNDAYGHMNGDIVLKQVAQVLLSEAGEGADVCRWGGEEFAVLYSCGDEALERSHKILERLRSTSMVLGENSINITASMGLVMAPENTCVKASALVQQADDCLYRAKECGRNRLIYQPYREEKPIC